MGESVISAMTIYQLILMSVSFFFAGYFVGSTHKRKKIYRFPSLGWLKVSENPIPEDIDGFIATDGEEVSTEIKVTYNSKGKPLMGYGSKAREITEWQPLPEAPRKRKEKIFLFKNLS